MKKTEIFSLKKAFFAQTLCILIFLVFGSSLPVYAGTYAQNTMLTVQKENSTIGEIFSYIEKNSEFIFVYHGENVDLERQVSVNVRNKPVEKILDEIFKGTDTEYLVRDRQIIVRKDASSPVTAVAPVRQQESRITVNGKITDSRGDELIGVNVYVEGTTNGTITDLDGMFTLSNIASDAVLVVSYVGYKRQDVPVNGRVALNITLQEDSETLDEVIVVGYGVQKKVNLSGAVDAISSKSLESRPVSNVNTALQGMASNLNIAAGSGRADDAPDINIRGFTSINGGGAFILVDNVPVSPAELARMNPDDIENVSVLKDASAAAIYGSRAAYGVILITTKKAKDDKLTVNFSGNYALRTKGIYPEIVTDLLTVMEMKNAARTPLAALFTESQLEYARQLQQNPNLDRVIINPDNANEWSYFGETDWQSEAYKNNAGTYTANLNISNRTDKLSYFVSGQYYKQDGMLRYGNDIMKRYNFRGNADYKLTDWWKVGTNISYTNSNYESPSFLDGYFLWNINRTPINAIPRNPDGTWTADGAATLGALQEGGRRNDRINQTQVSVNTEFDLIKDIWKLNADVNFRRTNFNRDRYVLPVPYRTGPNQPMQYSIREGESNSYAELRTQEDQLNVYNVYSNFTKTFNKKHYLNVMAGYNREYASYRTYNTRKVNLITAALPEINLATGNVTASNTWNELALEGYFGRVNYIYDNRYIVEFNGRYDGSSRFPKGDRWGFFPSGSLAWVLSQEKFMEEINEIFHISNLKVRASYGSLGNQVLLDDNGNAIYYPSIASLPSAVINYVVEGDKPTAVRQPGVVAKNLTWETVSTVNVGFDLSLFNNKFMFSFDKYTRYTNDMLTRSRELPAVFGATEPKTNAADLKTKGWEITASYRDKFNLMSSPFDWSVKFMIADYKSWITKYDNPTRSLNDYYEGQRIGEIWGFINDGYFASQAELDALDQSEIGTDDVGYIFLVGDLKYKDLNGDKRITKGENTVDNPGDRQIIGNKEIRFPYSFELTGAWKGFDLRMFFQGVGKRDWYPEAASIYFWGIYAQPWTNVTKLNMDHWTPENPNAYFPRVKAYIAEDAGMELAAPQTKYLQNAAYLRFKNLTLGYTLPKTAVDKLKVSSLRFYFSAENIWTLSFLDENLDPEVITNYSGFDSGVYPMQRTYSIGMNLTF